jgi:tRNA-dihydrouridine synthase B
VIAAAGPGKPGWRERFFPGPAPAVLLAPMAGASDPPFRRAAQRFGCAYSVSEIVAGELLARARPDVLRRASGAGSLSPLVIQLAGRDGDWLRRGATLAQEAGADVIDINMGCPAKKVTSGACGAALMRDLDHAERLIEAIIAAACVPVTLKMRLGWDEQSLNAAELARRAQAAGIAMLVVHGRTRRQFYQGAANWRAIKDVVEAVGIPVIANGDVTDRASAQAALRQSGASGVMIGRAAMGKPWLVGALGAALRDDKDVIAPPAEAQLEALMALHRDCLEFYGARLGLRVVRKHLAGGLDSACLGLDAGLVRAARARICTLDDPAEIMAQLHNLALRAKQVA